MPHEEVAERIRTARESRGWTQEQLAFHADLAVKTVWTAEGGKRPVTAKTLRRLGDALGIDFFERAAS